MAAHHSPSMMQMASHGAPHGAPTAPPVPASGARYPSPSQQVASMTEAVWMQIGSFAELVGSLDDAMQAYEHALRANRNSIAAMNAISLILRTREEFNKAVEYLQAILKLDGNNGEVWGSLGHCYLMMDDLQQAYSAYQNALVNLPNVKEPKLWYGIGILYDRYGSLEHAEEAFSQVMQMQPDFEKANEIYFRLGIIYKQQSKYSQSLDCFKYIVSTPPHPLTEEDIWFQIGHVHEQQKDYDNAKAAYLRVLDRDPNHAKVLQQLGWLHHQQSNSFSSQERAIEYLEKSVAADPSDAQSWYLLGRCYMSQQKYPKAYEAYQQAVYRDGRNPTFWCSIGVLYYQINQYRDALDAYSRAIRLNPYISEVWYDLGTLYESCNNQINDAVDAYQRAAELDPANPHIKARLQLLRSGGPNSVPGASAPPQPADVHPYQHQTNGAPGPPSSWGGQGHPSGPGGPTGPAGPSGPGGPGNGWGGRLSEINPPPQPPNPYDQRPSEPFCVPAPMTRPLSPRDPMRPQGPSGTPSQTHVPPPGPVGPQQSPYDTRGLAPLRRPPSPRSAGGPLGLPGGMPGPSGPPGPGHYATQGPLPHHQPSPAQASAMGDRGPGPSYITHNGPPSTTDSKAGLPPFRPASSPRNDGRVHDSRMPSPKSAYPSHQTGPPSYHPEGPVESGPHPSQSTPIGTDGPMRRMDDHGPPSGSKRPRDWDDESMTKKQASEETRARLDDVRHRRLSTPSREVYRSPAEARRPGDDLRRPDESPRHPSEAYHSGADSGSRGPQAPDSHPMTPSQLPPMQSTPQMQQPLPPHESAAQSGTGSREYPLEERSNIEHTPVTSRAPPPQANEPERASRKVDVNEDYDDSDEEDKKPVVAPSGGVIPSSSDVKKSPATAGINGILGPKTEASS